MKRLSELIPKAWPESIYWIDQGLELNAIPAEVGVNSLS